MRVGMFFSAVDGKNPRQTLLGEFEEQLKKYLVPLGEELLEQVEAHVSTQEFDQIMSVRDSMESRILAFLDCWREAEKEKFWDLFNVVCSILSPTQGNFTAKLRHSKSSTTSGNPSLPYIV